MAPVDREKLRSHLDHIRGDLRRLERIRDEDIWTIIDRELGDFETFMAAIVERYFADPPQS